MTRFRKQPGNQEKERMYPNKRTPHVLFGRVIDSFSRKVQCGDHADEMYVLHFGQKPQGAKGHLHLANGNSSSSNSVDWVFTQLQPVISDLTKFSKSRVEGPYGEAKGKNTPLTVENLANEIVMDMAEVLANYDPNNFDHVKAYMFDIIERAIDKVRPFVGQQAERIYPRVFGRSAANFHFDMELTTRSDELPIAGNILSDEERIFDDIVTGGRKFLYNHPFEQMIILSALLRYWGIKASPSTAMMGAGNGDVAHQPLISVVDMRLENPLWTFGLLREHPDMGSVRILSDTAVMGAIYGMRASNRAKQLAAEYVRRFVGHPEYGGADGEAMPDVEFNHHIDRIASDCIKSYELWGMHAPGNSFEETILYSANNVLITAIQNLDAQVFQAMAWTGLRSVFNQSGLVTGKMSYDPFLKNKGIPWVAPLVPINEEHIPLFIEGDERFMQIYPHLAEVMVNVCRGAGGLAVAAVNRVKDRMQKAMDKMEVF